MSQGRLLLIGTPIGNLGDLSPRALEAIRSCSLLLCEDTRHTRKLLNHFGVDAKVESFHEHNEIGKADRILDRIAFGDIIGLVSDAGMPVLSDPGFPIVQRARERKIRVEPIPGPFAGAVALAASGIAPLPFAFFGFSPHRHNERLQFYRKVRDAAMTAVVYESPQRLIASLEDAQEVLGDVEVTIARELTKLHEELINGTIASVIGELKERERIPGEITLVFGAAQKDKPTADPRDIAAEFQRLRDQGVRRTDAVKMLADRHGLSRSELYQRLLGENESE